MLKFEVAVHNKDVRTLVRRGEKHKQLTDDWAETHYIEIMAADERDARAKVAARYPADKGFVIEEVMRAL